jgi:hypothetical protein
MIRRGWLLSFVILATLVTGGCSDPVLYQSAGDTATYRVNRDDGTAFFSAMYDNPDDKPTFDDIFRLHADQGYVGDIDDTQYADVRLQPGHHVFTFDLIDWAGYSVDKTATLTVDIASQQSLFIEAHVTADRKPILVIVDKAQGAKDITVRKRECPCDEGLFGLSNWRQNL